MPHPPNILVIITDQQSASMMSCAGNPHLQTPAMDRLARRGVRFERAYCTQPLCVPSRASLATGRWPHELGVAYNYHPQEAESSWGGPWLGQVLGEAGYQTAWIGKWHLPVQPERVDVHGFTTTLHARGNKLDPDVPPAVNRFLHQRADSHRRDGKDEANPTRPLLLVASFVNPHDICEVARGDPLPNGGLPAPPPPDQCPPLPDNFAIPDGEPDALRRIVQPAFPANYPTGSWDEARWRQYRWAYHRLVERVDGQVDQVLDTAERAGLLDDAVIVFTSDHGDGGGAHQWNQKQVLYDEATRVPLILCDPRQRRAGEVDKQALVSMNLDLMPTLCDYAEVDLPVVVKSSGGRSLRPWLTTGDAEAAAGTGIADERGGGGGGLSGGRSHERDVPWRKAVFCETEFAGFGKGKTSGVKGRMVRTDQYKYVVYSQGGQREQLFDLDADPGEMHDLSANPDYARTLAEHRRLLSDWGAERADDFPFVTP